MANAVDSIQFLAELLSGQAIPVVSSERLAPSTFYDLRYRIFVIASAFEIHAKPYAPNMRRIQGARLKLLQFIACRPWLLGMVRVWSKAQHDAQLSMASSQRLRRGFLGDTMHDDVVSFLVARGILSRMNSHLADGPNTAWLGQLHSRITEEELFGRERHVLKELVSVKITNAMLEGW
jgi:hypothetical protein